MRDTFGRGKQMHLINWRISLRLHLCKGATDNRIETASGNDHRECEATNQVRMTTLPPDARMVGLVKKPVIPPSPRADAAASGRCK